MGLLKQRTIASGNTLNAKGWTDGEMSAPMLPRISSLIKCSLCESIIWNQNLEVIDTYETYIGIHALFEDKDVYKVRKKDLAEKQSLYDSVRYYE